MIKMGALDRFKAIREKLTKTRGKFFLIGFRFTNKSVFGWLDQAKKQYNHVSALRKSKHANPREIQKARSETYETLKKLRFEIAAAEISSREACHETEELMKEI